MGAPVFEKLEQEGIAYAAVGSFRKSVFLHSHPDQLIRRLSDEVRFFDAQFNASTLEALNQLVRDAARVQLIDNPGFKQLQELAEKPRERRRFDKLRIAYRELADKKDALAGEIYTWKKAPSRTQAQSWLDQLNSGGKSWFGEKPRIRALKEALTDTSVDHKTALKNWLAYLDVAERLPELERQLADWGIERPQVELDSAVYILRQLEAEEPNELNRVAALPKRVRKELQAGTIRLQRLLTDLDQCLQVRGSAKGPGKSISLTGARKVTFRPRRADHPFQLEIAGGKVPGPGFI